MEVKKLLVKSNAVNCAKSPISLGIVDFSKLKENDSDANCVKRPISVGIVEPVVVSPTLLKESKFTVD